MQKTRDLGNLEFSQVVSNAGHLSCEESRSSGQRGSSLNKLTPIHVCGHGSPSDRQGAKGQREKLHEPRSGASPKLTLCPYVPLPLCFSNFKCPKAALPGEEPAKM